MAYSNLGSSSYVELNMATAVDSCLEVPAVKEMAQKYSKSAAQIVLRWGIQRGTTVIPKTSKKERLAENIALFDFNLSPEEMKAINSLNMNRRFNDPGVFCEGAFNTYFPIYE